MQCKIDRSQRVLLHAAALRSQGMSKARIRNWPARPNWTQDASGNPQRTAARLGRSARVFANEGRTSFLLFLQSISETASVGDSSKMTEGEVSRSTTNCSPTICCCPTARTEIYSPPTNHSPIEPSPPQQRRTDGHADGGGGGGGRRGAATRNGLGPSSSSPRSSGRPQAAPLHQRRWADSGGGPGWQRRRPHDAVRPGGARRL